MGHGGLRERTTRWRMGTSSTTVSTSDRGGNQMTAGYADRPRLETLLAEEEQLFARRHPRSLELFERARTHLLDGVPMNWMTRWTSPYPVFVAEELSSRFGLPYWQVAMTATDANRFVVRLARHITERPKILVFDWCYHGTVDETFITVTDGVPGPRPGNIGPPVDPAVTTKVIQFNDLEALEAALVPGDVACVLAEPVMTNIGIIHPDPGYHEALRDITRRTGTLLVIDETHTICTGPGGYTKAYDLSPDFFVLGKPIGSGIPCAVYGFTEQVAGRIQARMDYATADVGGIGGTLSGNALALAAMRATLRDVLNENAYAQTIPLAEQFNAGVESVIAEFALPWIVKRLGCRTEYWFRPEPPRNGSEAVAAVDEELDRYMHLFALNRDILMTPFHNMALIAPGTTKEDVQRHTEVFRQAVASLYG